MSIILAAALPLLAGITGLGRDEAGGKPKLSNGGHRQRQQLLYAKMDSAINVARPFPDAFRCSEDICP